MIAINLEEIQRDPGAYLRQVEAGETLVALRAGKPVAEIKPITPSPSTDDATTEEGKRPLRPFGLAKGEFTVPADFDDPLPEEILRLFSRAMSLLLDTQIVLWIRTQTQRSLNRTDETAGPRYSPSLSCRRMLDEEQALGAETRNAPPAGELGEGASMRRSMPFAWSR
jgi:antitoxin (DNA-binding transcriptional repressor) of toxin-antitoxin stability system